MQHWEINFFSLGTFNRTEHSGALAGIDANYGLARDLEVHSTFFLGYNANAGESTAIGMGGLELGIKYRFLSPSEEDWWPQIASRRILACRRSPPARTRRRGRSCVGSLAQHLIRRMPKGNCRIIVRRWWTYPGFVESCELGIRVAVGVSSCPPVSWHSLVRPLGEPFFRPDPHIVRPSRAAAVKDGPFWGRPEGVSLTVVSTTAGWSASGATFRP